MSRYPKLAILAVLLAATAADLVPADKLGNAGAEGVRAVFIHVSGEVTLTVPQADGRIRVARLYQVIPPGATITVPPSAAAFLVCSTHHQIALEEPSEWSLSRDACAQGLALEPEVYLRIAPRGGRLRSIGPLMVAEHNSRGEDDPLIPVLLSPRNTSVLEDRPTLQWTAIAGASDYRIELQGRRRSDSFIEQVPANEVDCAPDPETWDANVCVFSYPEEQPPLAADGAYFLTVGARRGIRSPLYQLEYGERLHRLRADQEEAVKKAVADVEALPLTEAARWVTLAGIYADRELFADAVAAYHHALALQSAPELWVGLGDVYLYIGLPDFAEPCYRKAGEASAEPDVEAAVAFGLGQSHLVRRQTREALKQFQRARGYYLQLGLQEEAELASKQAAKAKDRLPR